MVKNLISAGLMAVLVAALAGCPPPDPDTDGGLPDGAVPIDSGMSDGSADSGKPAPDGGVVPDGSQSDSGEGDAETEKDAGVIDSGTEDGGIGDAGAADGGEKISKFGMVNISYSESATHAQGTVVGQFFGIYKPGRSKGGGGGWVGPELDGCVYVQPAEPCEPPECTPAEYELVDLGDVAVTGFVSGPITLKPVEPYLYYYPDGEVSKAIIDRDEFLFGTEYAVAGDGRGYGPFSAKLTMPPRLKVLTPDKCFIDQRAAMTVTWEGEGDKPVWISYGVTDKSNVYYSLFCQAENDGFFVIPQEMMEKLPADVKTQSLTISNSASAKLTIPGMDTGSFSASVSTYMSCY